MSTDYGIGSVQIMEPVRYTQYHLWNRFGTFSTIYGTELQIVHLDNHYSRGILRICFRFTIASAIVTCQDL